MYFKTVRKSRAQSSSRKRRSIPFKSYAAYRTYRSIRKAKNITATRSAYKSNYFLQYTSYSRCANHVKRKAKYLSALFFEYRSNSDDLTYPPAKIAKYLDDSNSSINKFEEKFSSSGKDIFSRILDEYKYIKLYDFCESKDPFYRPLDDSKDSNIYDIKDSLSELLDDSEDSNNSTNKIHQNENKIPANLFENSDKSLYRALETAAKLSFGCEEELFNVSQLTESISNISVTDRFEIPDFQKYSKNNDEIPDFHKQSDNNDEIPDFQKHSKNNCEIPDFHKQYNNNDESPDFYKQYNNNGVSLDFYKQSNNNDISLDFYKQSKNSDESPDFSNNNDESPGFYKQSNNNHESPGFYEQSNDNDENLYSEGYEALNDEEMLLIHGPYKIEPFLWEKGENLYKYVKTLMPQEPLPKNKRNVDKQCDCTENNDNEVEKILNRIKYDPYKNPGGLPDDHPWIPWIGKNFEFPKEVMMVDKSVMTEESTKKKKKKPTKSEKSSFFERSNEAIYFQILKDFFAQTRSSKEDEEPIIQRVSVPVSINLSLITRLPTK